MKGSMNTPLLNSVDEIKKLDQHQMLETIELLHSQISQVWNDALSLEIPSSYKEIDHVVVAGMGGSVLGTHVIQTLFREKVKLPILICPDYTLPSYVGKRSLVVASSYSGNTEETLSAAQDAQKKGAHIAGITSGGKLAEFLRSNHYPSLVFDPVYNPSSSPRMGLGYSIFGQMMVFSRAGLLDISEKEREELVLMLMSAQKQKYWMAIDQEKNHAKLLAFECLGRIPVIVAAEHLEGVAHVFANQLNENAKTYSEFRVIPEMDHHLLEGFQFPTENKDSLFFIFAQSNLYSKENQKRVEVTKEIVDKHGLSSIEVSFPQKSQLLEAFEFLQFGAYTSFYLSMLHHRDPEPIPWVDYLKKEIKK
ncbi:MAG: bifunctional phosphoglucose/phosphomannose isomerase [Candidatus Pacebacteria bacterium]|nr:bifunctional phosphoglucose/phosphomannose isomerase [Candidatus Paceibacterota bacterium]